MDSCISITNLMDSSLKMHLCPKLDHPGNRGMMSVLIYKNHKTITRKVFIRGILQIITTRNSDHICISFGKDYTQEGKTYKKKQT